MHAVHSFIRKLKLKGSASAQVRGSAQLSFSTLHFKTSSLYLSHFFLFEHDNTRIY